MTWLPEIEPRSVLVGAANVAAIAIVGFLMVSLSNRDSDSAIRLVPTSEVETLSSDLEPGTESGSESSDTASEATGSESNRSDPESSGRSATFQVASPTVNSSRPSIGPSARTVRVPSLIGRTVAAAETALGEAGLVIDFAGGAGDGGRVVRSEPGSDALVEPGATVTVWVVGG